MSKRKFEKKSKKKDTQKCDTQSVYLSEPCPSYRASFIEKPSNFDNEVKNSRPADFDISFSTTIANFNDESYMIQDHVEEIERLRSENSYMKEYIVTLESNANLHKTANSKFQELTLRCKALENELERCKNEPKSQNKIQELERLVDKLRNETISNCREITFLKAQENAKQNKPLKDLRHLINAMKLKSIDNVADLSIFLHEQHRKDTNPEERFSEGNALDKIISPQK